MTDSKKCLKDYESFLEAEAVPVPMGVVNDLRQRMKPLLNPRPAFVFLKVLVIHLFVGSLSLAVCHQFGINPFGTRFSLDRWFMDMWGHGVCMILCGVLFVGLSFLIAGYFLSIEEVRTLRRTEFLQSLVIGITSLLIFTIFGASLALIFASLWLLGALLGGCFALETMWKLRLWSLQSQG